MSIIALLMPMIETILTIILTPTLIVGGVMFVLRKFFEQLLSRDIEKFKVSLQTEADRSKLQLQNQLQAELFEFQTKFSGYYQKQAEVIGTFYEMLSETQITISELVHPIQFESEKSDQERLREGFDAKVELARFFEKRRIYFDDDVCQQITTALSTMHKVLVVFQSSQRKGLRNGPDVERWNDAFNIMEQEVPVLKNALESRFRHLLSGNQTQNDKPSSTTSK